MIYVSIPIPCVFVIFNLKAFLLLAIKMPCPGCLQVPVTCPWMKARIRRIYLDGDALGYLHVDRELAT